MVAFVCLAACGGGKKDGAKNNIELSPQLGALTINQGTSALLAVDVTRTDAKLTEVTVMLGNAPDGVVAAESVLPLERTTAYLHIYAAPDAELGSSTLTLSAAAEGGDGTTSITLEIIAAQPSSLDLINQALESGTIDYPTSVLYRAYAAFAADLLPEAFHGTSFDEDASFFADAQDPSLPPATQEALRPFLVRPADPTSVFQTRVPSNPFGLTAQTSNCVASDEGTIIQGNFKTKRIAGSIRVWVQCSSITSIDDQMLEDGLSYAQGMYAPMTSLMGEPILDNGATDVPGNIDTAIDIYIVEDGGVSSRAGSVSHMAHGVTAPSAPFSGNTSSGYILIGRSRALSGGFRSTEIHEFFHVLQNKHNRTFQFAHPANDRPSIEYWWVEASATWASSFFARGLAPSEVYVRYRVFQGSTHPLHESFSTATSANQFMYAAFVWGFFMEHDSGGSQIIRQSWDALHGVAAHAAANTALDGVFHFDEKLHEFAIANINDDLPDALSDGNRHRGLDSHFPEPTPGPTYADRRTLSTGDDITVGVDLPALRASYYRYVPSTQVKKIIVHFDEIPDRDGLDIDAVRNAGGTWKTDSLSGRNEKVYCLDRDEDRADALILVLSNHNVPLDKALVGQMRIEAFENPCKAAWVGTLHHRFTAMIVEPPGNTTVEEYASIRLEQSASDLPSSQLSTFEPVGTWSFTKSGSVAGCVLQVPDYHGSFDKDPTQGVLLLDGSTHPIRIQATLSTGIFQVTQHADCEPPDEDYDVDVPQIDSFMLLPFADGYTVSDDGLIIDGVKSVNYGDTSGELFEWHLTRQDS
jgi:hypothetical protein